MEGRHEAPKACRRGTLLCVSPCPICQGAVRPRTENPNHPFCSARCKTVDLGRWLSEEYRVPVEDSDETVPTAEEKSS